jgi:hypothetical protein
MVSFIYRKLFEVFILQKSAKSADLIKDIGGEKRKTQDDKGYHEVYSARAPKSARRLCSTQA